MSQKRAYKQYSKEFKEEAVALVNDQGYTVPEAAKSLGINPNMPKIYRVENPLIVEISYGFAVELYDACPGYWDEGLNWVEGEFVPQEWMVASVRY